MRHAARLVSLVVLGLIAGGASLVAAPASSRAADSEYALHVILPLTGGAAFVGKTQQSMLQLLEPSVNREGGIAGRKLRFIYHDDQTSPQVAVQLANEVLATHPSVILGSAIAAMCNAMAPLMQNGPVMYCLSPGIRPAAGSYIFSGGVPTQASIQAIIRWFRLKGVTRIAMLSSSDATGQDSDRGVDEAMALPENASLSLPEHIHFNPSDVSVAAQIERVRGSGAGALIAWTTGAPAATIFKAIVQAGLDIPIATSGGNQQFQQLEQYISFLPRQLLIPSALFPEHDGLYTLDPRVEKVQHEMYALLGAGKIKADNATGTVWDPALIVIDALRKLGPEADAAAIRSYIANLTDFAGVNGLYDFKAVPQRGLGIDNAVVVRFDPVAKQWVWLSKPGGVPFAP